MAKKTLLDNIIESIKDVDGRLIKQSGTTKQMISDLNYKVVAPAKSAADSAQSAADAAVASAQVTSDAVSAIASATAEAKQGANEAMSRAKSAWDVATGAKEAVTDFDPLLKQAQSDAKAAGSSAAVLRADMDKVTSLVNDPKTGLNATYQTAAGNATTISNVKSDVYQLETTANGLTSRVGNLESKTNTQETEIQQNKNAITLKADQTDVNTLKGNVTSLQAEVTTQANEITTKVTQSDVTGMLTGYATQNYTQSLVTQKANDWNLNLTSLKTDVNAIKTTGGGVNLLCNSIGKFQPNESRIDNYIIYDTSTVYMTQGQQYTVHASASNGLVWSGTHNNSVENNNVVLWLTDNTKVSQIISDSNTGTRTTFTWNNPSGTYYLRVNTYKSDNSGYAEKVMLEKGTVAHDWSPAPSDMATVTSVTNLSATVDGIQAQVYNSDGTSKITQLSNLIATKVSQGDYNSQITQFQNDINLRVQKGDVISQINQEAGGNTLIQVSNGKGSLVLDAANTVITGKAWIPVASIADLTADQIQAGTLTGSTVHLGDSSGNTIDLGVLGTNHVGLHSSAQNGDQTYIDSDGIHNYGATYDTKISQGMITTNLLTVNGGGLIDFRSGGSGATLSNQELQFYNSNSVNGGLSFSGSVPIAPVADGVGGNELRIRYDRSFAVTPISDDSARICASPAVLELGFVQSGSSTPDLNNTGLWVHRNNRYMNLGVWETDSTWTRISAGSHNIQMQANDAHAGLYNNNFHIYRDNDGGSATATELQVDGWAWVRGWVEAAGHSQHSALSTKTDIQPVDDDKMLKMVNDTDLTTFLYKTDVASGETHRHIGLIIDDVHDVAQYQAPQDFIAPNGVSRDDDNMIGALFGAVKALTKRIKALESKAG